MGVDVPTGIPIVGDVVNNFMNRKAAEESDDREFRHNVQLWEMNNEYNKPINQMARLQEAGLNPNLVYGNGSVVGNTSSQPSAPNVHIPRFQLDLTKLVMGKQLKKMDEEIKAMMTRNEILEEQLAGLRYDNKFYDGSGVPRNAPWYAKYALKMFKDPTVINGLKSIGYNIGDIIYDVLHFNPSDTSNKDGFSEDIPLSKNGKITIE